jgi:hypothetical protein
MAIFIVESSHIQLTSHVFPPSAEKDYSIRDDLGEMLGHSAQALRGLPKFAGCKIHLAFR